MGDNSNWTNLGEKFLGTVSEALNTGDFTGLNDLVSDTVSSALQEARRQAMLEKERRREHVQEQYDNWLDGNGTREALRRELNEFQARRRQELQEIQMKRQQALREQSIQEAKAKQTARTPGQVLHDMRTMVKTKRVGSVSGVLYTVFGGIGVGVSALCLLGALLDGSVAGSVFFGALLLIFVGMLRLGMRNRARLSRFERYIQLCGYKMYGMVEDLASQTGRSVRYVRRDLRRMLNMGFFPEGHLDAQGTCFMLNDTVYSQYIQTAESHKQAQAAALPAENAEARERETELNTMVAEGMESIRRLRDLNDAIPGEPVSGKLFQMENLLNEIFDRVREHPEQMPRMHKLMDYYLPTTLKLVEAYREFSSVSAPGEDILSAMREILGTLDTINQAFKELLNELFQDAALDVTTDAQVLQTMLAREGLTREMEPLTVSRGNVTANAAAKINLNSGGKQDE